MDLNIKTNKINQKKIFGTLIKGVFERNITPPTLSEYLSLYLHVTDQKFKTTRPIIKMGELWPGQPTSFQLI